jgi:hypothetical protein
MNFRLILPLVLVLFVGQVQAQGEIDSQKKIFYRNERSMGLLLNSNGFGMNFRYGKWLDARNKQLFEADLVTLKHPKEVKYPFVNIYTNNRSFIYGKMNTVFDLRAFYGKQYEVFQKVDKGGIAIRYFYGAGPSLAIYKPIYYDIWVSNTEIASKKFDISADPSAYTGRSSFFKGFKEIRAIPGASVKGGINFEFSTIDEVLHALEVGMTVDLYPLKVPIMAETHNNQFFFTVFVCYRFGRILDPLKGKQFMENKGGESGK